MDSYEVDQKINEVVKTIVDANDKLLRIIDKDYKVQLLPTKFSLNRAEQLKKIEEEYKEFLEAHDELFQILMGCRCFMDAPPSFDKIKFHAGEECCDLIVSCLTYLQQNFSREEQNKLFEFVNNKNRKRGYLED